MSRRTISIAAVLVCTLVALLGSLALHARPATILMDNGRQALLYRAGEGPRPTILVLHGFRQDAAATAAGSGFVRAAAARGFNVVFPDAIGGEWHDSPKGEQASADVEFLSSLVGKLTNEAIAKSGQVFIAGISNGGLMAFAAVCARPDLFAGIGTVVATMPREVRTNCSLPRPIGLTMIVGDADEYMPYEGGVIGAPGFFHREIAGAEQTAALFAAANGCERTEWRQEGNAIEHMAGQGCKTNSRVDLIKVLGGTHSTTTARRDGLNIPALIVANFAKP